MSERREETPPERPAAASPAAEEAKFVELPPPPQAPSSRTPVAPLPWLVLAAMLVAVVLSPYWAPPVASILPWGPRGPDASAGTEARLEALERKSAGLEAKLAEAEKTSQRIAALEQRLAQAETKVTSLAAGARDGQQAGQQQAQALASLSDRLAGLEQRLSALTASSGSGASAESVKALETELKTAEQKIAAQEQEIAKAQATASGSTERLDAALLVAVGQLRQAIATSAPYSSELSSAKALARDRPEVLTELQKLDASAARGIPSRAVLSERLAQIAPAVLSAEPPPADADWGDRVMLRLKRFFNLRRVGEGSVGGGVEAALAAAETAMRSGDLAAAVAAMKRVEGPAAEPAKRWLADAEARLGAEATVAALDAALLQRMLAGAGAAKP
ncbi:MAG TPA: hypothetical protein VMG55_16885 [Stellaceae bacterium]|nr:hypothetical protein [Stellaceae bacterium]